MNKKGVLKKLVFGSLVGLFCLGSRFTTFAAPGDINLENDIPNIYIREEAGKYDTNHDGILSDEENKKFTSLDIDGQNGYVDPTGIDKFIYLKKLDISNEYYYEGTLEKLNFSAFKDLEELYCKRLFSEKKVFLNKLNLKGCSSLKILDCSSNKFDSIDISSCTSLTKMDANNSTSINMGDFVVPAGVPLNELNFEDNFFKSFKIEKGVPLKTLKCRNSYGKIIDVSAADALEYIEADYGEITDFKVNKNIGYLDVSENKIKKLDLSDCSKLYKLNCSENKLTSLNLKGCNGLEEINCSDNKLKTLNLSVGKKLKEIYCQNNQLKTLTLGKHKNLVSISCFNNKLIALNIKGCPKLSELEAAHNKLKKLDIKKCKKLKYLNVSFNNLKTLKVTSNKKLKRVYAYGNSIKKLNVTGLSKKLEYDGRWEGFYNEASQKNYTKLVKENGKRYISYSSKKTYLKLEKKKPTGDEDS